MARVSSLALTVLINMLSGKCPLLIAADNGHMDVVKYLLDCTDANLDWLKSIITLSHTYLLRIPKYP